MKNIEENHFRIIKNILKQYPYTFYAYGSRVKGTSRKFSDLDLCYRENIPVKIIGEIREKLEESNLPYRVDLVSWDDLSSRFKKLIEGDLFPVT